jgi:hypothetical protein
MMKRITILVLVVAIVVASCSSSGDDDSTNTTATAATEAEEIVTTVVEVDTVTTTQPKTVGVQYPAVFIELMPEAASATLPPEMEIVELSTVNLVYDEYVDQVALATSQGLPPLALELPEGMHESEWDARGCIVASDTVVVPTEYLPDPATVTGSTVDPPLATSAASFGEAERPLPSQIAGMSTVAVPQGKVAVEYVFELISQGIPAWPHYAAFVQPRWRYGPGSDAVVVEAGVIPDASSVEKSGTVVVIDAFGVHRTVEDENGVSRLSPESGHGEFVAGIVERMGVNVIHKHVDFYGSSVSSEIAVAELIQEEGVYNLSLGTDECVVQEGGDLPGGGTLPLDLDGNGVDGELLALPPVVLAKQIVEKNATVVAAAGNDSSASSCHEPLYPAGYMNINTTLFGPPDPAGPEVLVPEILHDYYLGVADLVLSVGAAVEPEQDSVGLGLPHQKNRAAFSNCGDSTFFAPGVGIISDYPPGGTGFAMWSGTSFATPIVAALSVRAELTSVPMVP